MTGLALWRDSSEADRTPEPSNLATTTEAQRKFRAKKVERGLAQAPPFGTNFDGRVLSWFSFLLG